MAHTKILEKKISGKEIKVLSLGCGFSPDLIALEKYIEDKQLQIKINYTGIDNSNIWKYIRINSNKATYENKDILDGFCLKDFDIVFMVKLFSTLLNNSLHEKFLNLLREEIRTNLKENSFLIFADINHHEKGKDLFDKNIKDLFKKKQSFFFPIENAYKGDYEPIRNTKIVYEIPENLAISPKDTVCKTVIFEYRK